MPVHPVLRGGYRGAWRGGAKPLATAGADKPELTHQPLHRAARHPYAFSIHLHPDLIGPVDLPVGVPDSLDLWSQLLIAFRAGALKLRIALTGSMQPVTRWGDLQNSTDRLDAKPNFG